MSMDISTDTRTDTVATHMKVTATMKMLSLVVILRRLLTVRC